VRVLFVNHTALVSGGEISLLTLIEGLPGEIDIAIACPAGELADKANALGIEIEPIRGTDGSLRLHPLDTPRALAEMALAAKAVRRVATIRGADLIHANSIRSGLIAIAAGAAVPRVVHVRDCLPPGAVSSLTLSAIGHADALIANSEHTRRSLGPRATTAHVVHNAVDMSRFDRRLDPIVARRRLGVEGDGPVLTVVAQITPWKGQDDAIRIVGALADRHPGLMLMLAGSAKFASSSTRYDNRAYLDSLHALVEERGLTGKVKFLGERSDVPEVLAATDLLLVPSWEEPFGRSIIEAMAAGVAVAATEAGGPSEILIEDGRRLGLLLPPREPAAWVAAIDELLDDPDRIRRMGDDGREAARRRFDVESHVASVLEVYRNMLGPTASSAMLDPCSAQSSTSLRRRR
jgi:glycosyltransferase involved in cell wall biosynthesis